MIAWVDAQLPPALAKWLGLYGGTEAFALREVGLRDAGDQTIFASARASKCVLVTKDADFIDLSIQHGPPRQIVWVTCGNSSNRYLLSLFEQSWPAIRSLIEAGEAIVELGE